MSMKKSSNYVYFNPNPKAKYKKDGTPYTWHIGDCSTRALCGALGLTWLEVFDMQYKKARKMCCETNAEKVSEDILKEYGFEAVSIKVTKGSKRPTVSEVAEKYKGYVGFLHIASHNVCIDDGLVKDVWDCGDRPAYKIFVKKI